MSSLPKPEYGPPAFATGGWLGMSTTKPTGSDCLKAVAHRQRRL